MLPRIAAIAACAAFLAGATGPERSLEVVTTNQVDFTGGTVRVDNAQGQLNIEAWDQPRVEITVTRTTFEHNTPKDQEKGKAYLNRIKVTARKNPNGDVEIFTQFPGRNRLLRVVWGFGDFNLDYRIKVPRNSNLAIRHGIGSVIVNGVAGGIDATVRTGDIVLQLPDPDQYAIDARCRFGDIYTDYDGAHRSPWLVGQKFDGGSGHTIHLRALLGGISIQRIPDVPFTPASR